MEDAMNLIVRPDSGTGEPAPAHEPGGQVPDSDDIERYAVVAGGRRLKAMQALVEDKVLDANHPVPCQVRSEEAETAELSLAENVMRVAMHPADQVTAFSDLARAGQSVSAIAARFGTSERTVEQRLRLGNAAPELLDAYRADEIDLETLKAFAVTADHERQMAVWEQVSGQDYRPSAWQVKRLLTEERVPGASAIARFVGVDDYEAAGGAVMRDLFADEDEHGVWLEDPVLLEKLAMERLQAAADELATRWKWAIPMIEAAWNHTASFGRIEPQPGAPTDEEQAEIAKLEARHDELNGLGEDDWTEELVAEAEAIEARLDEIEGGIEARAVFRREDFSMAGCIVSGCAYRFSLLSPGLRATLQKPARRRLPSPFPTTARASPIPPCCSASARTAGTKAWSAARTPPASASPASRGAAASSRPGRARRAGRHCPAGASSWNPRIFSGRPTPRCMPTMRRRTLTGRRFRSRQLKAPPSKPPRSTPPGITRCRSCSRIARTETPPVRKNYSAAPSSTARSMPSNGGVSSSGSSGTAATATGTPT